MTADTRAAATEARRAKRNRPPTITASALKGPDRLQHDAAPRLRDFLVGYAEELGVPGVEQVQGGHADLQLVGYLAPGARVDAGIGRDAVLVRAAERMDRRVG